MNETATLPDVNANGTTPHKATPPASGQRSETGTVEAPCPKCGARLVDPENLGWCPKCRYCRTLEQAPAIVFKSPGSNEHQTSPFGVIEFYQLVKKLPNWLRVLVAGSVFLLVISTVTTFLLPANSLIRALWSTVQLALGLIGLIAAQAWALIVIAPEDDGLGAKDLVFASRLWNLTLKRLPETRRQVWLGAWSVSGMLAALFLIGGLSYWYQFYKPERLADKNLLQRVAELARNKGKDKSLTEAVEEFANMQDLTKKKEEPNNAARPERRATLQCAVIGYTLGKEKELTGLLVVTLQYDELRYVGVVKRGFTKETGQELLKRLRPLTCREPAIPGVNVPAIWVKPEVLCEIHQSGYDDKGELINPSFGGFLAEK
jgi:hypothetical protein